MIYVGFRSWACRSSCSLLLPTELLPGEKEAMSFRVTRNTKISVENKLKISMAGAKRMPVSVAAACRPGLRLRRAPGDAGNNVSGQPRARQPLKEEAKT